MSSTTPATTPSPAPPTPSATDDFFQNAANIIADDVEAELKRRGIPLIYSSDEVTPSRHEGLHAVGTPNVYQVTCLELWPDNARHMPARDFRLKYLRRWTASMALKLARPGVLTTYRMTLPKGVEAAALGHAENLTLRCIVDFSMHDGRQVLRLDALASWDD